MQKSTNIKDSANTKADSTVTISRFGPSGSLKERSSVRESITEVIPNMSSDVFFDLKYI
jgi:hypothetical protein